MKREVRGATLASGMPSDSRPGQLLDDERMVLDLLLAGDHPVLETLRAQATGAWVSLRNDGGQVRHARLEVPAELPRCDVVAAELADVMLEFDDDGAPGRALLLLQDGQLSTLDIVRNDEDARPGAALTRAAYCFERQAGAEGHGPATVEEVADRDWPALEQLLAPVEDAGDLLELLDDAIDALAERPQDSIALPLVAPVVELLDRLVPSDDPMDELPPVMEFNRRVGRAGLRVAEELRMLWSDDVVAGRAMVHDLRLPVESLARGFKQMLREADPGPLMAALVAIRLADGKPGGITGERARPLARLLYQHARNAGITEWASAYQYATDYWSNLEARDAVWELVLFSTEDKAQSAWAQARSLEEQLLDVLARTDADGIPVQQPSEPAGSTAPATPPVELSALRDESERLRSQVHAGARELETMRTKKKQLSEQARELTAQLAEARAELEKERKLRRAFRNQLLESRDAEEAGDHSMEPPPEEGWSDDLLAGYTIMLFTGQDRASAREAMAEALRDVGAMVTVEECNSKGSVPGRFQDGVVVVTDVRFTGHAASDRIRAAAEKSGVRLLEVKAGEGGIVRAVAGKLRG